MHYEFHPAANEFPLMDEKRLSDLAEDIHANGQRESIRLFQEKILDGRNRYRACIIAGATPRYEKLPDDLDPWAYVWSLNGARRDLTADQRYLIWKSCSEQSEAWKAEQTRIQDEGNKKRAEATKVQPRTEDGKWIFTEPVVPLLVAGPASKPAHVTSEAKATASKTHRGAVERMDHLSRKRPDLADKVKLGDLPAAAALREMKREEVIKKLDEISAREVDVPTGEYDVIVIDPPWPMQKIERDVCPNQVGFDYPTLSEAELAALPIPSAENCHMWLWTTHKFLPMALRLLDAWKFKYVCTFVWHKPGGFQPFGLPQFNCEFALYARKGSPQFVETKAFNTCFVASRGAHSEKPEEFYETVRRVTAGRRLDMFSRRKISGFRAWGKEAE